MNIEIFKKFLFRKYGINPFPINRHCINALTTGTLLLLFSIQGLAAEQQFGSTFKYTKNISFGKNIKSRGIQLSEQIFLARIKTAGKYRPGIVLDRKTYAWGLSNRGISIHKRF